jgi:hypothetical protein
MFDFCREDAQIAWAKQFRSLLHANEPVSKSGLLAPLIYKNEHFTKTGSGQKHRENSKKGPFFLSRCS